MTDIYDEREDFKDAKLLTQQLRSYYIKLMRGEVPRNMDLDTIRRCTELVSRWPGDELVMQLLVDGLRLMEENGVSMQDLLRRLR